MLSRWADAYARQIGQDVARVRRWISFMALGGALEQAGFDGTGPRFSIKGGVALELRLGGRARATRDLDLVLNHPEADLLDALDSVLRGRCEGFSFKRRGDVRTLPSGAVRADVAVQYGGSTWGRIQVDLGRMEGDMGVEVEMVDGLDLSFFRFRFPEQVPCLSLYSQSAQKIHGLTLPSRPGRPNERFKDLVDLLLIEELIKDHQALRTACEQLFASRNTHPWPPFVEAPGSWAEPFRRMADEVDLPVTDVNQAAFRIRSLLHDIDPRAQLFRTIVVADRVTATNWYYALGRDEKAHRIPVRIAEALINRELGQTSELQDAWYREPGGIALVEIQIFLRNRAPIFVAGSAIHMIAAESAATEITAELPPPVWENLAGDILRRAGAVSSSAVMLAVFLSAGNRTGMSVMAEMSRVRIERAQILSAGIFNHGFWTSAVWSFADNDLVVPSVLRSQQRQSREPS
jgi:hypothetical protein